MEGQYFDDQTARAQFLRAVLDRGGRVVDKTTRVEIVDTEDGPFVVNHFVTADLISEDESYVDKVVLLNYGVARCQRRLESAKDVAGTCRICFRQNKNPVLCSEDGHFLVCKEGNHLVCPEHAREEPDGTVWCDDHRPGAGVLLLRNTPRYAAVAGPPVIGLTCMACLVAAFVLAGKWVIGLVLRLWEHGGSAIRF